jgi:hypothetical protein
VLLGGLRKKIITVLSVVNDDNAIDWVAENRTLVVEYIQGLFL